MKTANYKGYTLTLKNGIVTDHKGNIYIVRTADFRSDYSALFCNDTMLNYWNELSPEVQDLFK